MTPQLFDRVKILRGDFKGQSGLLISYENKETSETKEKGKRRGVVKLTSNEETVDLDDLGVLYPEAQPETLEKGCYTFAKVSCPVSKETNLLFFHSISQKKQNLLQTVSIPESAQLVYSSSLRSLITFHQAGNEIEFNLWNIDKKEKKISQKEDKPKA